MNSTRSKVRQTITAVLLFASIFMLNDPLLFAQEQPASAAAEEGVKVEKISASEWNIINKNGEFVGKLKSESLQTFTFYNTSGVLVGTIMESGAWQPRQYRSRNTLIQPDEAQLYLDALEATSLLKNPNASGPGGKY